MATTECREIVNCQTCGTGKRWWLSSGKCSECFSPNPAAKQPPAKQLAYDIKRHAEMLVPSSPEQWQAMLRIYEAMKRESHLFPYWKYCHWHHDDYQEPDGAKAIGRTADVRVALHVWRATKWIVFLGMLAKLVIWGLGLDG